uniref:REPA_OB_2 domain-containing protein n=1 Tax=Parastrongyloides trichosuri TaxID=131310 RepID=A0A0N4ZAA1_PARTI
MNLGSIYLVILDKDVKINDKKSKFGNFTNVDKEITINEHIKFLELPVQFKFDHPGYNVLPVDFKTCESYDTSSVDILGRIVKITPIENFIQPKSEKVSCKRHMFLVDKNEKVIAIAIFGQRCFKIGEEQIDKIVLIKGVSIKRHESGFQYISIDDKSLFLNEPESLINDMVIGTQSINKDNLVYPEITKVEKISEILNNCYTLERIIKFGKDNTNFKDKFVYCFVRVLKWGTFGKGKYELAGTPTETANRKNQDVLYTRVTLNDSTAVQGQISLFSNRIVPFINKNEIAIRRMIEEKNELNFMVF